jgi:hypothetical protein
MDSTLLSQRLSPKRDIQASLSNKENGRQWERIHEIQALNQQGLVIKAQASKILLRHTIVHPFAAQIYLVNLVMAASSSRMSA